MSSKCNSCEWSDWTKSNEVCKMCQPATSNWQAKEEGDMFEDFIQWKEKCAVNLNQ